PFGASTVAPATPVDGSPRSFEQVILQKFDEYGISKTNLCNPYVIDYPKPYGTARPFTAEIITTVDTCNCNRFAELKADATTAGFNANQRSTLNQYLLNTYNDTLTQ